MAEIDLPEDLLYSRDDEWVRDEGDGRYVVGITDYAQQQLGDVVFVELPEVGTSLAPGQSFGVIESVKAVSDLFCPVGGDVADFNSSLEDSPETVNEDCYGDGWLIVVDATDDLPSDLMNASAYRKFLDERAE